MVREQERKRRLLVAGFILHDFEKFNYHSFVRMPQKYKDLQKYKNNKIRELSLLEHREIIDVIATDLSLDRFISPNNPEAYHEYLDDLLCIAYNAQRRRDRNWNFSTLGLNNLILKDRTLGCLSDLVD